MDRRRRKSREAIVQAFVRLFFEDGYDAVSLGKVAAAADVGRSTLYTHFRRKEELLQASMDHHLNILADTTGGEVGNLERLMAHFWENRRRRSIFAPGRCRDALASALTDLIERRLGEPANDRAGRARLPVGLAARLIAEHQLAFLHHWMSGQTPLSPPEMASRLAASVTALQASLQES